MKPQLKYGIIETFVLSILTHGESYGYKIVYDLSNYIEISESTLYPILRRLEVSKAIISRNEIFSGRNRKYYKITTIGEAKIDEFMKDWQDIRKISEILIKRGKQNEFN
ncbi:MAG: PadR family transcriptional regulator [Acholeplasmatales bacterium]|jgi:PadR family transcriptional regulator PadR|nr:PadR family transcriptional regulator [Acholeplasmatales bacterium]